MTDYPNWHTPIRPNTGRRGILTTILADTEAGARALIPPERPGWRREVSVDDYTGRGLCYAFRVQVLDTEGA